MNTIFVEKKGGYAILHLDRGRSNPINTEMAKEIISVLNDASEDSSIGGIIINGKPDFFSVGVDIIELYDGDKAAVRDFWTAFFSLTKTLLTFDKPLIASITGHSPAGGCVLAICCDYRVMSSGKYKIGLNEIPVGIVIPANIFAIYKFWIGERKAYQYLMEGHLLTVQEALEVGLVDAVGQDYKETISLAEQKMQTYLRFDANTWSKSKRNIRGSILESVEPKGHELEETLKHWWLPKSRGTLGQIVASLQIK